MRPITRGSYQRFINISIHAPYKRVRPQIKDIINSVTGISIHAPYKRVRHCVSVRICWNSNRFQSTHPTRECDLVSLGNPSVHLGISIHVPYKRVRPCMVRVVPQNNNHFNPRTLQESATVCRAFSFFFLFKFQSTHPTRECDDIDAEYRALTAYFNPRTLQESATVTFTRVF